MSEPHTPEARLPAVDDRLVKEGSRAEIIRGELFMTPPADEPHATRHLDLAYVLRAHVAAGYTGAVDMLTRTGDDSDFAPDASVFPSERDPKTGGRRLEVMAFEVVGEQRIGVPSEKARELARRGVRRIFGIVIKTGRALEWSRQTDGWQMLSPDGVIEDACLARPLPVRALLDAVAADAAVIAALEARGQLDELKLRAREEGREEGRRQAVHDLCEALGVQPDRVRVASASLAELEAIVTHLKRERAWPR